VQLVPRGVELVAVERGARVGPLSTTVPSVVSMAIRSPVKTDRGSGSPKGAWEAHCSCRSTVT
jgi:hypothetical protein